mgnify:CR=1 FL=1
MTKPTMRPARPDFSSGPCAKRPGWTPEVLKDAAVGRSHRSKLGKKKIVEAVDRTRSLLGIPADYRIAIVPASDTGAVEMALWSLLGARPVDMLTWESFGEGWVTDVAKQLKLKDVRVLKAPYGQIADLKAVDWTHDVVFTWNGTTSGVKVPNGDWIADDRQGLAICDATSAVFAMDLPWPKLDVVTWSWQKVMGGEGAHGMLVLSPRAIQRHSGGQGTSTRAVLPTATRKCILVLLTPTYSSITASSASMPSRSSFKSETSCTGLPRASVNAVISLARGLRCSTKNVPGNVFSAAPSSAMPMVL